MHRIAHTMSRLRILFAWLLIAAVPMQGFTAASMLFCGMGAQHQHTDQASEPHAHATDSAPDASPDGGQKCSICAACCNGVALVGVSHMAAVAPAAQAELADPFVLIHTRPTPVPDKPPRA